MLSTTYQHDYVSPFSKRYEFLRRYNEGKSKQEQGKQDCECIEEHSIKPPTKMDEQCMNTEWTGIAPMGKLINPRIIPTGLSPEQYEALVGEKVNDCFKLQPNRFLKILRTAYPDLYDRLKQMPKDEINRRIEKDRFYTTYQIDFCNINEYPEGIYESLKQEEELSKRNNNKLLQPQGACSEFRNNVMQELDKEKVQGSKTAGPCDKAYKPFKISFVDSSRFTSDGSNSHWRTNMFAKRANFTEYMDTINRNGCVIMRNKIHDHSKCMGGKHCRHQLMHTCVNLN